MEISATLEENVAAVAVKGRLDSSNADGLKERLGEMVHSGSPPTRSGRVPLCSSASRGNAELTVT